MVNGGNGMVLEFEVVNFLLVVILNYVLLSSFNLILNFKFLTDV